MVGPGGRRSAVCWGQLPEVAPPVVVQLVLQLPEVAPPVLVAPVVVAASMVVAASLLQVVAASLGVSVALFLALP